jgi:hypothetical protein
MLPRWFVNSALILCAVPFLQRQSNAAILEIHVHSDAKLDEQSLNRTLSTFRTILTLAGATPETRIFCGKPSAHSYEDSQERSRKIVDLRISLGTAAHAANWRREPLGQSVVNDPAGTYAVIYLESVKRQARAANLPWTTLAAYASAHEIGHLLLGADHSPTGVMKASWDAKDMLGMCQNSVHFDEQQRRSIVACCTSNLGGSSASH